MSERQPERTRAFIAADLPEATRAAVVGWRERALGARRLRLVPAGDLHVTLSFLGELDPERLERTRRVVARLAPGPIVAELQERPLAIPSRRPRLLALAVHGPALVEAQEALVRELVEAGVQDPPGRPFLPHLTVARRRGRAPRGPAPELAVGSVKPLPPAAREPFGFVRVALYRSQLRSQGARYSPLAAIDLPPLAADEVI